MAPIVSPPAGIHPGAGRHHQGRALLTVNLPAPSPGVGLPVLSPLSFGATFQAGGTLEGGALERRLSHLGRFHTGRASYRDVLLALPTRPLLRCPWSLLLCRSTGRR